jgi:hypothetical protein
MICSDNKIVKTILNKRRLKKNDLEEVLKLN